jgi:hypothetical protein
MTHLVDTREIYRRHAEACLAVLTKTNNPASQAMLTAMARTLGCGWQRQGSQLTTPNNMDGMPTKRFRE